MNEPSFDFIKTDIFDFPVCKMYLGTWAHKACRARRARRARKARWARHLANSYKKDSELFNKP